MSSILYLWRVLLTSGPNSGTYTTFYSATTPTQGPNGESINTSATVQLNVSENLIYQKMPDLSLGRAKGESVITSPSGANQNLFVNIVPNKSLNVYTPPSSLFYDVFEINSINTLNLWSTVVGGNGTISQSQGVLTINSSSTSDSFSYIVSKPFFKIVGTSMKTFNCSIALESTTIITNNVRYWGIGILESPVTATLPYSDGYFFKINSSGVLSAVCLNNHIEVSNTTLSVPLDGKPHDYSIVFKSNSAFFYIDDMQLYVASTNNMPQILNLYVSMVSYNTSGTLSGTPIFNFYYVTYDDSSSINSQLSDANFPWRKSTVNKKNELVLTNNKVKFRDGFADTSRPIPDTDLWDISNTGNLVINGGNSSGSSYLLISLSPFLQGNETVLTTKAIFDFPFKVGFGISSSQRLVGQELAVEFVGYDEVTNIVPMMTPINNFNVSASQTTTTITLTFTGDVLPITGGMRVIFTNFSDSRLNIGPVVVTITSSVTFTVPSPVSATIGPLSGTCIVADQLNWVRNAYNMLIENTNSGQASLCSRRNGSSVRYLPAQTVANTAGSQTNNNPYTDSWNSSSTQEIYSNLDEIYFRSYTSDSLNNISNSVKLSQGIPDEELKYKLRIRAKNLNNFMIPSGRISSINKTGTTTATVVTDVAHNLNATSFVYIYGIRDFTNFPNLTTSTQVASIIDSVTFTIIIGSASTSSSNGGAVFLANGGVANTQFIPQVIQSVASTVNGILSVVGSAAWATPLPGEYMHLYGLTLAQSYEGAYKVLRVNTTTLELQTTVPMFSLINTGGTVIRRTDYRIHFIRFMDYTRLVAEVIGGRGNTTDNNNAIPVTMSNGNVVISSGTVTTVTTVATVTTCSTLTSMTSGNLGIPGIINDVASAAITTTTTTAAVVPTFGVSYEVNIPVTAVTGTTPTLDVEIQESDDTGTNWFTIYVFNRITAIGMYRSPKFPLKGNRIRYVQTVGGTTPSFTRAINRLQSSDSVFSTIVQLVNRSIVLTTLNSTTPTLVVQNSNNLFLSINIGTTTIAPVIQIQGSDDFGTTWYNIGTGLTAVASSTVYTTVSNINTNLARAIVTTAGTATVMGYVLLKGY